MTQIPSPTPLLFNSIFDSILSFYLSLKKSVVLLNIIGLSLENFLSNTTHFQLVYRLDNTIPSVKVDSFDCYHWIIYQEFDFTQRNLLLLTIEASRTYCDSEFSIQNFWPRYMWVHVSCLILSLICLLFNIKYIYDIFKSYNNIKDKYKKDQQSARNRYKAKLKRNKGYNKVPQSNRAKTFKFNINDSYSQHFSASENEEKKNEGSQIGIPRFSETAIKRRNSASQEPSFSPSYEPSNEQINLEDEIPSWEKLTWNDKAKLFSYWVIAMMVSNVFIFIGSCLMIFNTKDIHHKGDLAIGVGGMLTWITLAKYYENIGGYNIVLSTFHNCSSIVTMALLGILPLFIGFGLLGMSIFWRSKRFTSLGVSMFSLFSLMNGDIVNDSYLDLSTVDYIISQIYLYAFIAMSVLVIQNVFIAIITDGYQISKFVDKTDWVKQASSLPAKNETPFSSQKVDPGIISTSAKVTDASPFAKISKTRKKDERSKMELVKMLWHDKFTYMEESKSSVQNIESEEKSTSLVLNPSPSFKEETRQTELELKFHESAPDSIESQIAAISNTVFDKFNLESFEIANEQEKQAIKEKYLEIISKSISSLSEVADKINKS